jgi:eukaryotic-like serine/threonine-protein kinase
MAGVVPELQLGKKLGNGHFGVVYLGQDSVHGRVAVKVLARQPGHSDTEWQAYKAGFLAEAQNLSKATHRNVVQVYHIEESPDGNSIRFCMAFCPGGSLQRAFEAGPMILPVVRKAATEVLMGLNALHARRMLHRDIKPANVLIDAEGVAQMGDFGLVTDDLLLGYGSQAGYSDHIAHEVWQGAGTSAKSDIWAFGMTLFRLLHGKTWYEEAPNPDTVVPRGASQIPSSGCPTYLRTGGG